jgi:hypothetical protein
MRPQADGGSVDTSCGLDCDAQNRFGLIVNRCFEYSSTDSSKTDPPKLGVWVKPVFTLEGGVAVLPVEYREGGQTLMQDSFAFENGNLKLMRREFPRQGRSVTFKSDASGPITGVTWLLADVAVGQTQSTAGQAVVADQSGMVTAEATTYRVTTGTVRPSQLKTPAMTYTDGMQVLASQTPDRGADPIRIFVPTVGFISLSTAFNIAGGNPTPVYLQTIRDISAGSLGCSLGVP